MPGPYWEKSGNLVVGGDICMGISEGIYDAASLGFSRHAEVAQQSLVSAGTTSELIGAANPDPALHCVKV